MPPAVTDYGGHRWPCLHVREIDLKECTLIILTNYLTKTGIWTQAYATNTEMQHALWAPLGHQDRLHHTLITKKV